jgi:hypothetical protein
MTQAITITIILTSLIAAIFFGWYFYQKAKNKERIMLIERGDKWEDILQTQKKNKFKFVFPWLKFGVITLSMSIAFLGIGLALMQQGDLHGFNGFLRPFILGLCLSIGMFINHFINKKRKRAN